MLIGRWIAGEVGGYICALFVVLGHDFPVFLRFKGGKGVAASLGVICDFVAFLCLDAVNVWFGK